MAEIHPSLAELSFVQNQLVEKLLKRKLGEHTLHGLVQVAAGSRVRLSPTQARIWFFSQLYQESAEYNIFETLNLDAAPQEKQLESALRCLMERHDALRLRIVEVNGEPFQEDCGCGTLSIEWHDLGGLTGNESTRRAREIGSASARTPFLLDCPPLFRVSAIRMPEGKALLIFVFHHIIADYWSVTLLLEELSILLSGSCPGPPAAVSFLDYVAWEQASVDEDRLARDLKYWTEKLGGELPILDLPKDRAHLAASTRRGQAVPLSIPYATVKALKKLAESEQTTLFVALLAAYKVFLRRVTGQTDLIVGSPLAGRDHPASENILGCFVKTVALRTNLEGGLSYRDAMQRVHAVTLEAQDHQSVPYEQVVAHLRIRRELNSSPVFQTMFGLQSCYLLEEGEARIGEIMLECDSAKWDLTVSLTETRDGVSGFMEYSSDLFERNTAERFVEMYLTLLASLAEAPELDITAHRLIPEAERNRILNELNPYQRPAHPYRTMAQPFEEQVERTPHAIALEGDEGTLSYWDLNQRANRLAHFLRNTGVTQGSLVALCMERSFAMIVALYAIAKSGAAYVPLDPELPDARLAFMLEETSPAVVIVDRYCRARIPPGCWQMLSMGQDEEQWAQSPSFNLECDGPTHHLVHLLYTSGSTGRPKAVAYPVDGAIADILWLQKSYPFHPGDANLFKTSYGFDVSIWEIFWPLYFGARLVICRPGGHSDPRYLVEMIEQHRVTTIFLIPTFMQVFLETAPAGSCSSLRWVFCGGEPVTAHIRDAFYARFHGSLINCYGPTEAGCVTDMVLARDEGNPTVPLGRPAANFRLYVLDENLEPTPIAVPGEVYLGGEVGLAHCYFKRPDLTAERFLPDPFGTPGSRMYRTGDLCRYRENGVLEHLGRCGRQVKFRGMRVELAEIENVLREHPAVEQCIVLLHEESQNILAFVVPHSGNPAPARDLTEHARRILPRHMVPAAFVNVTGIPANLNGKLDRDALLRCWRQAATTPAAEVISPCNQQERRMKQLFEQVLGIEGISVTESFFELGGHSLLVFKLISACVQEFQVRPSVADIFSAPSVRELCTRIGSPDLSPDSCLVPLFLQAGRPLIVFIHAVSGSALPFLEVGRLLADEFSIVALQSPEAEIESRTVHSVENLAALYVNAVDPVRGLSPVVLAGWSMGGCIAVEMARLWRRRGIHPGAILMLDTWVPPTVLASTAAQAQARTAILDMDVLGYEGFTTSESTDSLARLNRVLDRNRLAFLEYKPSWFDGDADVLRATEPVPDLSASFPEEYSMNDRGWSSHICSVALHEIGGNHFTLTAKENAVRLAGTIRSIVAERLSFSEI